MSLEKRSIRGDLIQVFLILKGLDSVDAAHFFELEDEGGYGLRGHRLKLNVQRCRLQVRQNFFSVKIVNLYGTSYRSPLWSLLLLMRSRRDWTTGLQMCIFSTTSQVARYRFFPIVDTCLSCENIAGQSCVMVPRWRFLTTFLRPVFSASRVQHVSDLHPKFALRPHHVWKYGRHPMCDR